MSKPMMIEEKIDRLMKWMQVVHDKLDMHEWVRDYRPWRAASQVHPKSRKCPVYCKPDEHEEFWVKCDCGVDRVATREEYDAATLDYNGY